MANWSIPDFAYQGLWLVMMLSLPTMVVAAVVGVLISIFQAATQIQDQSIGQLAKLIAVTVVLVMSSRWAAVHIFVYAEELLNSVGMVKPYENS